MNTDTFGVTQHPARKTGSRWTTTIEAHDADGHTLTVDETRRCRTRREAQARADIRLAKLSTQPGYSPSVAA